MKDRKFLCYRQWDTAHIFYVAQVPGDDGVDWGYTQNPSQAAKVSEYWMRRFKADCGRVGQHGLCIEI